MVLGLCPAVVCGVGLICLSLLQGDISATLTKGGLMLLCMSGVCTLPAVGYSRPFYGRWNGEDLFISVLTLKGIGHVSQQVGCNPAINSMDWPLLLGDRGCSCVLNLVVLCFHPGWRLHSSTLGKWGTHMHELWVIDQWCHCLSTLKRRGALWSLGGSSCYIL